jgi:hypothetical protein
VPKRSRLGWRPFRKRRVSIDLRHSQTEFTDFYSLSFGVRELTGLASFPQNQQKGNWFGKKKLGPRMVTLPSAEVRVC